MAKESSSNITFLCAEHAPVSTGEWADEEPKNLLGKWVKKSFPVFNERGDPLREHMWVSVTGLRTDGGLVGTLDNDPFYRTELRRGDTVTVQMNEIEAVYDQNGVMMKRNRA